METPIKKNTLPTNGLVLDDGHIVELIYDQSIGKSSFAVWNGSDVTVAQTYVTPDGDTYVPTSPHNNLLKYKVILFPSAVTPYGSYDQLVKNITTYIHTYVDISPEFETLAAHYVLLSWVYDAFRELPYIRFRGDFGSGKTRALKVIGSICYKPIFASGASTVSPIFHILNTFPGTLIFDEADFRFSDEKAELSKILNNGNVKGFPVLRTTVTQSREYDPRAFQVFGPKVVAMRGSYDDKALESRFITEDMGTRGLRFGVPINLLDAQETEALHLRNQLLMYRFHMLHTVRIDPNAMQDVSEARIAQILTPLASIMESADAKHALRTVAQDRAETLRTDRAFSMEANLLRVVLELFQSPETQRISVDAITQVCKERFETDLRRPITNRYIGSLLRTTLKLITYKQHGTFVVPFPGDEHIAFLKDRFGVETPSDFVPQ